MITATRIYAHLRHSKLYGGQVYDSKIRCAAQDKGEASPNDETLERATWNHNLVRDWKRTPAPLYWFVFVLAHPDNGRATLLGLLLSSRPAFSLSWSIVVTASRSTRSGSAHAHTQLASSQKTICKIVDFVSSEKCLLPEVILG